MTHTAEQIIAEALHATGGPFTLDNLTAKVVAALEGAGIDLRHRYEWSSTRTDGSMLYVRRPLEEAE